MLPGTLHHLRRISWFKEVSDDVLRQIAPAAIAAEYSEGSFLWRAGDAASHFVFVVRGLVQIVKATARGADVTLGIFGPGEGIGNIATMDHGIYPASAVAVSEVVSVVRIDGATLKHMMKAQPEILGRANISFIHKARALLTKIDVLCAGPVPARLALLFLHLSDRFGDELAEGGLMIPIVLSRGALSRLVSAREETVIRVLSQWKQAGWLSTTPEGFVVHAPELLESVIASNSEGL